MVIFIPGKPIDGDIYYCVRNRETRPAMVLDVGKVAGDGWAGAARFPRG